MTVKKETIERLEYNNIVEDSAQSIAGIPSMVRMIEARAKKACGLSDPRFYQSIMEKTPYIGVMTSLWHPKLRNMVAKSVIIEVAKKADLDLPTSYELNYMQQGLIVELPKDKPEIHKTVDLSPTMRSRMIAQGGFSIGFRLDTQETKPTCDVSPLEKQIQKTIRYMIAYKAKPSIMRSNLDTLLKNLVLEKGEKIPDNDAGHTLLEDLADREFETLLYGNPLANMDFSLLENRIATSLACQADDDLAGAIFKTQLAEIEKHICNKTYPNLLKTESPEKPMILTTTNFDITRPVMVGNIDILKASDEQLAQIIRDAQTQKDNDKDLAGISENFKAKAAKLDEVIALCISQLDKE